METEANSTSNVEKSGSKAQSFDFYRPFRPLGIYFRKKRMAQFEHLFNVTAQTRILDVGGTPDNWRLLSIQPDLTIVNLFPAPEGLDERVKWVVGDGRTLPFQNQEFDVVYSNSVIEHLGELPAQKSLAEEIQRVGVSYYVQTPNRWFPVEPHFIALFVHWLPRAWQRRLVRYCTVWGLVARPTPEHCDAYVSELRLLNFSEMQMMFPQSQILRERLLGLTKSLIATRVGDR
jgi:hypothetical protein